MMTRDEIVALINERLDDLEGECNRTCLDHNDGVFRGLLWALTGEDPGTRLLSRAEDIYKAMGFKTKVVGDHFHWGATDEELEQCELCNPMPG